MLYCEALEYINSYTKSGNPVKDLSRFEKLMEFLRNPQDDMRFIHIAGTNGKGSVTEYCSSVLSECGFSVGKFTSPFIINFRERIQINGVFISENSLAEHCESVRDVIDQNKLDGFSQFEIITAIGFLFFKEKAVDIVCLEVGIGGTLDCTNIIKSPLVSVITTIDLDHTAILGDTIEKIAQSKAGIIKGTKAVSSPFQHLDAVETIKKQCKTTGAEYICPDLSSLKILSESLNGSTFVYKNEKYEISMCGRHQIYNAITAIEAISVIGENFSLKKLQNGLYSTKLPARLELIEKNIILDGAHNPSGMSVAKSVLESDFRQKIGLIGMIDTKDFKESLNIILPCFSAVVFTDGFAPNAVSYENLKQSADEMKIPNYHESDTAKAVEKAKKLCVANDCIFCGGSLYLAAEIRSILVFE